MTKEELEERLQREKNRLAVLNAIEEIIVEKIGRDGFQEKVDESLDAILKYGKLLKALNQKA